MKQRMLLGLVLLTVVICASCQPKRAPKIVLEYDRPLPPGELALRKISDPNRLPDFTQGWRDLDSLQAAIRKSLSYLAKPSSKQFFPYGDVDHGRAVETLNAFLTLLDSGAHSDEVNGLVRAYFDVYESVGCDDKGTVLFTGYYTPIFEGALSRTFRFRYPLYKIPPDLVKGPDGQTLGRRAAGGQIISYPPRTIIEDAAVLRGQELIWLEDAFEAYIAHVQGSARIRLPDNKVITVGYAGNNGQEYQSIAKMLIDDGKIASDRMSLAAMIDYFKRRPEEVDQYVRRNPRYVFFQIGEGPPRGCLNEPVTAWRTIATDKSIFPRASLAFISTNLPRLERESVVTRSWNGFVLDQDAGGAIRAPGRCDLYMGIGDEAGQLAGQTYQEGQLYYLFLRP